MISLRKRVLLTLYLPTLEKISGATVEGFSYELLYQLFPGFSPVSLRSLIAILVDEKIVITYTVAGRTHISLSQQGKDLVRASFPALFAKRGGIDEMWSICLFGQALKVDPHFRKTRQILLQHGFFSYSKGSYLLPLRFPDSARLQLKELGTLSGVLIYQSKKILYGNEEDLIKTAYKTDVVLKRKQSIDLGIDRLQRAVTIPAHRFPQTSAMYQKILGELILAGESSVSIPDKYLLKNMRVYASLESFSVVALRYFSKLLSQ